MSRFRWRLLFGGTLFTVLFWFFLPQETLERGPSRERRVEVLNSAIRGYENGRLRWHVTADLIWSGYNPFFFRAESIGGRIFDDNGVVVIDSISANHADVDSKTRFFYAYDDVEAYFLPRTTVSGLLANTQNPVKVTAGALRYVDATKTTYLSQGVQILQGKAVIAPVGEVVIDNTRNVAVIETGFHMGIEDITVSGNRMEIVIDDEVSLITDFLLTRNGTTTNIDMDPREKALRARTASLRGDHMRFSQDGDHYYLDVSGNIVASQDKKVFSADTGRYDSEKNTFALAGNVRIVLPDLGWLLLPEKRKQLKNADIRAAVAMPTTIVAEHLHFDAQMQQFTLLGKIHIRQSDKDVRCAKMVYDDHTQKITLWQVTVLKEGEDSFSADRLDIALSDEAYRAQGKITTEFRVRKAP